MTKAGLIAKAKREGWPWRPRKGRGGGREYPLSALPEDAQLAFLQRDASHTQPHNISTEMVPVRPKNREVCEFSSPAGAVRAAARFDARGPSPSQALETRLALLRRIQDFAAARSITIAKAEQFYMQEARSGLRQQDVHIYRCGPGGSIPATRTVRRWREAVERDGPDALKRRATATLPPAWAEPLLQLYARPTKPSLKWAVEQLRKMGGPAPSYEQAKRFARSLGAIARNRGRILPREIKRLKAYVIRDSSNLDPGDVYVADGHKCDFEVRHWKTGRPIRPEIILVIDVATRKAVGWSAGLDESALLVADALRKAVETNGIPAIFYTDHGCGFKNNHFCDEATGILNRLGIRHELSIPYNSQARGVVERAHQSIWVQAGRKLPSFMGASMDREARQRVYKKVRADIIAFGHSKLLPEWRDFCRFAADEIVDYNARPHRGLPRYRNDSGTLIHPSPDAHWHHFMEKGWAPVMLEAIEAQDLFRPYEMRKVQRAHIRINSGVYFAPELEALDMHGQDVRVGFDPTDPTHIWIRDLDDRFLCRAELDASKHDYFPLSFVERTREERAKGQRRRLAERSQIIDAELGRGERPAIIASPWSDAERRRLAEKMAATPVRAETHEERKARAEVLEDSQTVGEILQEADEKWLRGYQQTSEYRVWKQMLEDFGRAAMQTG